ncbi:hypothetical protein, conserved in T. vivax, partial [Trypanosoma vivax Y486]
MAILSLFFRKRAQDASNVFAGCGTGSRGNGGARRQRHSWGHRDGISRTLPARDSTGRFQALGGIGTLARARPGHTDRGDFAQAGRGGGGERPCARRARAIIGGRAQQEGSGRGGVAGEACAKGSKGPGQTGQDRVDTLLCQAKEAKTQAEAQIKKAKLLAHEALWGKESGTVDEGTLQTKTWADSPSPSSLAGVAKADAHCVASNVLWLCMDGTNTNTANPCFKNAGVTALGSLNDHTHSDCHVTPATALQVWTALAPLRINATAKETRPAEELATTAL